MENRECDLNYFFYFFQCELSKGSKVYISIADKNSIKRKGCGDPAQLTRLGLLALFGRDTMAREQISAKGQRAGSKGIKKNVRDALLGKILIQIITTYFMPLY